MKIFRWIGIFFFYTAGFCLLLTLYWLIKDADFINISIIKFFFFINHGNEVLYGYYNHQIEYFLSKTTWLGIDNALNFLFSKLNGIISGVLLGFLFFWLAGDLNG